MVKTLESSVIEEDEDGILNELPDKAEAVDENLLDNHEINMEETTDNSDEETEMKIVEVRQDRNDEPIDTAGRPDPKPPPTPVPRRSNRETKPPVRFGDNQMYSLTPRPYDAKIRAMNVLLGSGILNEVDAEVAHRLMHAVIK